jgi:thiamine biosynthesis protein ThiI
LTFLIKYSSEIFTKSEITKKWLISILKNNLKHSFKNAKIILERDKKIIETDEDISKNLKNVFGISSFSKVHIIQFNNFNELIEKAYDFFKDRIKDDFKVKCKRKGSHNFHSYDVEKALREKLSNLAKVNIKEPKYVAYIEIVNNKAYLFDEKVKCYGGFPISSQGQALVLLSGGIDSAVSVLYAYKMGIRCDFLFYDLGGNTINYAFNVYKFITKMFLTYGKFYYVDLKPIIFEIMKNVKDNYRNVVLKAIFYKIANEIAKKLNIKAIITGESIGQVSTKTLDNLSILNDFSEVLIIRPLIAFTKEEIISKARELEIFDLCYKGKEYCAISRHSAVVSANKEKLLYFLNKISIQDAINSFKTIENLQTTESKFESYDVLIDLDKVNLEEFLSNLDKLDKSKIYLLKCKRGQLSSIIANEMRKMGFKVLN